MLAKILIGWSVVILGGFASLTLLAALIDVYEKMGWSGLVFVAAFLSALPALILGVYLKERN